MGNQNLPKKTREIHSNHFDSTIWNDFHFAMMTSSFRLTENLEQLGCNKSYLN